MSETTPIWILVIIFQMISARSVRNLSITGRPTAAALLLLALYCIFMGVADAV